MRTVVFSEEEPLVSKHEILKVLGVSSETLNVWARTYPDFPVVRLPGVNRYRKSDVAHWIESLPSRRSKKGAHV
jgi:predicted DNA-binding transcriptional regulator AlpA